MRDGIPLSVIILRRFQAYLSEIFLHLVIHDCDDVRNRFEHHVTDYKGPTLLFVTFQNFLFVLAVDCPWK